MSEIESRIETKNRIVEGGALAISNIVEQINVLLNST